MAIFVHVLLAIFSLFVRSDAFMCFECQGIPYPRDCANVRVCNSHEQCFTEQVVTTSGHVVYNTGCLSKTRCTTTSGMIVGKRSTNIIQRSSTDLSTCTECCLGNFCNNKGCGTQIVPIGQRGPYCFNCDAVLDPMKCSKVAVCDVTEQCMLYSPAEFKGLPETVHRSQCEKTSTCSVLSPAFSNYRCPPTCCDTDFCNNQCDLSSNHSMTTSLAHTTPSYTQTKPASVTTHGTTQGSCRHDHYYDETTGLCIKIDEAQALSYADAEKACAAIGDQLITIDSHEKTVFIERFTDDLDRKYFIGAFDKHHNGVFYWPNGRKIYYTNWGGGNEIAPNKQPDGVSAKHPQYCVILYGHDHYRWHDDQCSHSAHFICEDRSTLKENTTITHQTDIPSPTHHSAAFHCDTRGGYMLLKGAHENMCVHIVTHKVHWAHARTTCKSEGGDLVVLDNSEKVDLIQNIVSRHAYSSQSRYWIGAKDLSDRNNDFTWVNGRPVNYNNWEHGQPNGGDCICSSNSHGYFRWQDHDCNNNYGFICERQ